MLDRAIEKHAACAAAISCSGFEPGPSSKRDLYVYPPLMVSPAMNVPVPVGTSPVHSALPFAGIAASLSSLPPRVTPQSTPPQLADWFGRTTLEWSYSILFVANSHSLKCQRAQRDYQDKVAIGERGSSEANVGRSEERRVGKECRSLWS